MAQGMHFWLNIIKLFNRLKRLRNNWIFDWVHRILLLNEFLLEKKNDNCLHLLNYFIFLFQIDLRFLRVVFFPLSQNLSHFGSTHIKIQISAAFTCLTRRSVKTRTTFARCRRTWNWSIGITATTWRTIVWHRFGIRDLRSRKTLRGWAARRRNAIFLFNQTII